MYAIVRLNTFDPARLAAGGETLAEFDRLHRAQPGFLASLVIDLGHGQRLAVNLWATRAASDAGRATLAPHVSRTLTPLMSASSQLVGAGEVIDADLNRLVPQHTCNAFTSQ